MKTNFRQKLLAIILAMITTVVCLSTSFAEPVARETSTTADKHAATAESRVEHITVQYQKTEWAAAVYLPCNYDASGSTAYDLLLLIPGTMDDQDTWFEKDFFGVTGKEICDQAISTGQAYPFVGISICCPNREYMSQARAAEKIRAIIQAVENKYCVYGSPLLKCTFCPQIVRSHYIVCGFSYSADMLANGMAASLTDLFANFGIWSNSTRASDRIREKFAETISEYPVRAVCVSAGDKGEMEQKFQEATIPIGNAFQDLGARHVYQWVYEDVGHNYKDNAFRSLHNTICTMIRAPASIGWLARRFSQLYQFI